MLASQQEFTLALCVSMSFGRLPGRMNNRDGWREEELLKSALSVRLVDIYAVH